MDKSRRNFLKMMLIGGGTLLVGKVLNPVLEFFDDQPKQAGPASFRVTENQGGLSIRDNFGKKIFQIDAEA